MCAVNERDLLEQLAQRHGVATSYTSQAGELLQVSDATITYTLRALGVAVDDAPDVDKLTQALYEDYLKRSSQPLPPSVVSPAGSEKSFDVHVHHGEPADVHIELEDGGTREVYQDPNDAAPADVDGQLWGTATFHIPGDLPLGFHKLVLESPGIGKHTAHLIITPATLTTSRKFINSPVSGVMAQLYSVRSARSWGMGDFADLADLARTVAPDNDFLLINPLHAAEPLPPVEDSPYLPTTRRFINPIYLNIESIPELKLLDPDLQDDVAELAAEFQERNHSAEEINRNDIFAAKLQVLCELYRLPFEKERRDKFIAFCREQGRGLDDFARWCARAEVAMHTGQRHREDLDPETLMRFYSWLQFLCHEQLADAQQAARDAGMHIGIMTDLAVGVHPGGADAENLADYLAPQCSVGAPPDDYNQQGQDWSQPPWHPVRLAEVGYQPWRELVAAALRDSGGLRVDHILGLFRLFWIPRMSDPLDGTYVTYDFEAMLGILLLEAERAGAVLVGEDLGTLEPWVQEVLAGKGVLGTSILWFECADDNETPLPQHEYRKLALSSVNTHDLPPTLGYLRGEHVALRARLGLLNRSVNEEFEDDCQWQAAVREALGVDENASEEDMLVALHEFIAGTPSALTCTSLVDMVGDIRAQNQPGTTHELYPNWCIPLCDSEGNPVLIEDLADLPLYQRVARAARRS